jgi:hypothetical protein
LLSCWVFPHADDVEPQPDDREDYDILYLCANKPAESDLSLQMESAPRADLLLSSNHSVGEASYSARAITTAEHARAVFVLAGYLLWFENGRSAQLWAFWGVLALLFSRAGNATPMDETPVGRKRQAVGLLTLLLGLLCFTPMPISFAG